MGPELLATVLRAELGDSVRLFFRHPAHQICVKMVARVKLPTVTVQQESQEIGVNLVSQISYDYGIILLKVL